MTVKYSNITYEEVKQARTQALRPLPGSTREDALSLLKLSPFVLGWGFLLYIMGKNYGGKLFSFFCSAFSSLAHFNDATNFLFGAFYAILFIVVLFLLFTTAYVHVVKILFPIKTPIADKEKENNKFYDKTDYIEKILKFQDELKQRKVEDIQCSDIYIDGNTLEVLVKDSDHGLTVKHKFIMSDEEKEFLLGNCGVLDFSYLDNAWADQIITTKIKI